MPSPIKSSYSWI